MAFQALYRKWRSQTFDELVGQEHVVKTLRNAITAGRLGHAYLFTGPRGVGKTTMARLLAKASNCLAEEGARPCDQCDPCRSIADGRAVDVIEMDAASNRGVDDARELIERVQFRPTSLRVKVYVLDEVHMLTTEAFNALLKTLEEPPPHAMFILATTELHKVPATILSRCQRFVFNRHSVQDTIGHLVRIAESEGIGLEGAAAEAIARAATGSMRDAVSILDQLMAYGEAQIGLEMVRALLGSTAAEEVRALIHALVAADTSAALRAINSVADQGADLRQFTRDLVEELRRLMLLKAGGDHALIDAGAESLADLRAIAAQLDAARLLGWLKLFSGLDQQLRSSPYGQLPLELAVVEALIGPPAQAPAPAGAGYTLAPPGPPRPPARTAQASAPPVQRPAAHADASLPTTARPAANTARPAPSEEASVAPAQKQPVSAEPARPAAQAQPAPAAPANWDAEFAGADPGEPDQPADPDSWAVDPAAPAPLQAQPAARGQSPRAAETGTASEADSPTPVPATAQPAPPAPAAGAQPAQPVTEGALVLAEAEVLLAQIEELWPMIVEDVKPHSPTVQALLRSCVPISMEGNILVVGARSSFHHGKIEQDQNRRIVEKVLSKAVGQQIGLRCELITEEQQASHRDARRQREELLKDPVVRAARNIFDANIVGVQREDVGS